MTGTGTRTGQLAGPLLARTGFVGASTKKKKLAALLLPSLRSFFCCLSKRRSKLCQFTESGQVSRQISLQSPYKDKRWFALASLSAREATNQFSSLGRESFVIVLVLSSLRSQRRPGTNSSSGTKGWTNHGQQQHRKTLPLAYFGIFPILFPSNFLLFCTLFISLAFSCSLEKTCQRSFTLRGTVSGKK